VTEWFLSQKQSLE
jgi:hypothetical protein